MTYYVATSFILAFTLWFIITGFMFFHFYLIISGFTTIEFCEKRGDKEKNFERSPYNLSLVRNFKQVLGPNVLTWFVPIDFERSGEGLYFEVSDDLKGDY